MRSTLSVQKSEVTASGGMVTALHPLAAEAGAEVLRRGGNARWMRASAHVLHARGGRAVHERLGRGRRHGDLFAGDWRPMRRFDRHTMRAPLAATPTMFELIPGAAPLGFYGWPAVRDNANIVGYESIAVPGSVAGLCLALERFGTIDLDQALRPAIALAEQGFPVDWALALHLASGAREMREVFGQYRAYLLSGGWAPLISEGTATGRAPHTARSGAHATYPTSPPGPRRVLSGRDRPTHYWADAS